MFVFKEEWWIFSRRLRVNESAGWDDTMRFHNVWEITFLTPPLQNGFTFCAIAEQFHQIFQIWQQIIKSTNGINPIFNIAFYRRRGRCWWNYIPIYGTMSHCKRELLFEFSEAFFSTSQVLCPPEGLPPCRGRGACVPRWPQELCRRECSLLVGSPMPDRSKGRGLTKCNPLVLQVGSWAQG